MWPPEKGRAHCLKNEGRVWIGIVGSCLCRDCRMSWRFQAQGSLLGCLVGHLAAFCDAIDIAEGESDGDGSERYVLGV
jgi:hypothetical protein